MIPASELTRSLRETTQALKLGSGAVRKDQHVIHEVISVIDRLWSSQHEKKLTSKPFIFRSLKKISAMKQCYES
jgi:hypothetical protein